jgi:hypothetical protein
VVVFVLVVLPAPLVVVVFVVLVVVDDPLLLVFDVFDVEAGVIVDIGDEVVFVLLVVLVVLVVVLVFDSPGHAAPNKPNVKTAERAITFFISIKFSCLLQRMYIYLLFNDLPRKVEFLNLFWNNGQYKRQILRSQLGKW